jgi:hypothetical protein
LHQGQHVVLSLPLPPPLPLPLPLLSPCFPAATS